MRSKILYRYVISEIFSPFWVSLFIFTGMLCLIRSLKLIDLVINKDVPVVDLMVLFSFIIPRFLEVAIPMALLIAIIFAFTRLSTDSELVVIRATGISLHQLVKPVAFFTLIIVIITLLTTLWIRPWANYQLGLGIFEIAKVKATSEIVPGVFNELGQLTIYAEKIDPTSHYLENVIIADRREENSQKIFIAKNGYFMANDKNRTLILQLYHGTIHEGNSQDYHLTDFEINNISIDESALMDDNISKDPKKTDEMFFGELLSKIRLIKNVPTKTPELQNQLSGMLVEFHRRFALPVSCIAIALLAMALGVQPSRGGFSWGASANIIMGLFTIISYYLVLGFTSSFAEHSSTSPLLLIWSPTLIFLIFAGFLYKQMGSERWLAVSQAMSDTAKKIGERLVKKFG